MSKQLTNLLYSASQYDEDDGLNLNEELDLVHDKYSKNFPSQSLDEDDAMQFGNGQSLQYDNQQIQWNNQQQAQHYFREVAGNSQQFSRSLSINRHDLLQSRGMHDNSINLQNINLHNILQNKRKQQQKVNEVVQAQIQQLLQEKQKYKLVIAGQKKQIKNLQETVEGLQEKNTAYQQVLQKKNYFFQQLKNSYKLATDAISEKEKQIDHLYDKCKQFQKQNERLNEIINAYTQQQRNLTDFRPSAIVKKNSDRNISPLKDYAQKQLQKQKRQNSTLQTQKTFLQQKLSQQKQKLKSIEQDYKRKLTTKQKRIKQLQDNLETIQSQSTKTKKTTETSVQYLKDKHQKLQRDVKDREQKIKLLEVKSKNNVDEIRKKQEKIKQLLGQIQQKNKKINQVKDQLQQQEAKNQIETKLQKQRQIQIDQLQTQVAKLKKQTYQLNLHIETLQKPTNNQLKYRKQLQHLKSSNQKLNHQIKQLNEDIDNYERQAIEKDQKIKQLKKKYDEINKKLQSSLTLSRKRSNNEQKKFTEQEDLIKQLTIDSTELRKQNNQLRKTIQNNQQKLNKLFIIESRQQQQLSEDQDLDDRQDNFCEEQHIAALQEELDFKDDQIQSLKQAHLRQVGRLTGQINTLQDLCEKKDEQLLYKQKQLTYIHQKFVDLEKQNTELRVQKNILHSSFYDESCQGDGYQSSSSRKFLQNKISSLESKIHQKQTIIAKLYNQDKDRQTQSIRFQNNKLRSRVKQLKQLVLNSQNRKLAPQSLSQQQTIQFLEKTIKRILKSNDMIKILSKMGEFRTMIYNLYRILEKNTTNSYNHNSHMVVGSNYGSGGVYRR